MTRPAGGGKAGTVKVTRAPRTLQAAAAALFVLVPVAVVTARVFSMRPWWDPSFSRATIVGAVTLAIVAPISWRLVLGRRGAWELLAAGCGLACAAMLVRAAAMRGTAQAIWAVLVSALCAALVSWARREQKKSYFDPEIPWFQGLPAAIPQLTAVVLSGDGGPATELQVCRLDSEGLFAFSRGGPMVAGSQLELELRLGDPYEERRARISGFVVRHFEGRSSQRKSGDWGVGVAFARPGPDAAKDFGDFLEVLRAEGHIHD